MDASDIVVVIAIVIFSLVGTISVAPPRCVFAFLDSVDVVVVVVVVVADIVRICRLLSS